VVYVFYHIIMVLSIYVIYYFKGYKTQTKIQVFFRRKTKSEIEVVQTSISPIESFLIKFVIKKKRDIEVV